MPEEKAFSGFVFKIQANMDPAHRDRIAFLRVCSGRFERGMKIVHHRLNKTLTIKDATMFMARNRSNIEEAFPGDIIGLHNRGTIKIGDTFSESEPLQFTGIPSFASELFRSVQLKNPLKSKQLKTGLKQLSEEGAVQFFRPLVNEAEIILGAVGILQFDVTQSRLKDEYGVDAVYQNADYVSAQWPVCADKKLFEQFIRKFRARLAYDAEGHLAYLVRDKYLFNKLQEAWPDIKFRTTREHGA